MTRADPVYVYPAATKLDLWTKTKVSENAAKKQMTESEYLRLIIEAWHIIIEAQKSGNPVIAPKTAAVQYE